MSSVNATARNLGALALACGLVGCTTTQEVGSTTPEDPKRGLDGALTFFADHCFMPGCAVGPLMVGMTSKVSLSRVDKANVADGTSADSTAPDVATAKIVPRSIANGVQLYGLEIVALKAGAAEIRVLDPAGAVVDRLAIEARVAASFTFAQLVKMDRPRTETTPGCTGCVAEQAISTLSVDVNKASSAIYVQPVDAQGQRLEAASSFDYGVEDTKVAKLDCQLGLCITFGNDNMSVRGVAAGTTSFFVLAAGVRGTLPLTVK